MWAVQKFHSETFFTNKNPLGTEKNAITVQLLLTLDFVQIILILHFTGSKFGTTTNTKGYKMLPPYLRVIQGDGISYESLGDIMENMKKNNWSVDNLAFGSGGL